MTQLFKKFSFIKSAYHKANYFSKSYVSGLLHDFVWIEPKQIDF